jgi:hypothetical protein
VSAPDQDGIAGILIGEVKEPQSLPNDKSLRYYCQTALAANVCGVSFNAQFFARIIPLDGHGDARVDALATANLARPDPETQVFQQRHRCLLWSLGTKPTFAANSPARKPIFLG